MDIKFNKKVLGKREDMRAIWFPGDWQRIIVKRAKEEGMDIYKYVMMLSNNHKIYMDRAAEENEMKDITTRSRKQKP
jgi:LDH2 family malate/lactate/ureidoglycolate dehydrogenase